MRDATNKNIHIQSISHLVLYAQIKIKSILKSDKKYTRHMNSKKRKTKSLNPNCMPSDQQIFVHQSKRDQTVIYRITELLIIYLKVNTLDSKQVYTRIKISILRYKIIMLHRQNKKKDVENFPRFIVVWKCVSWKQIHFIFAQMVWLKLIKSLFEGNIFLLFLWILVISKLEIIKFLILRCGWYMKNRYTDQI